MKKSLSNLKENITLYYKFLKQVASVLKNYISASYIAFLCLVTSLAMAQVARVEIQTQIKSPPAKVYGFLKNDMYKLVNVFPQCIKGSEMVQGAKGHVGNVILYTYDVGTGSTMTGMLKLAAMDDSEKSVTFEGIGGDMMVPYKRFISKPTITDQGIVKWSFQAEKANDSAPNPDGYGTIATGIVKAVDAYLLAH